MAEQGAKASVVVTWSSVKSNLAEIEFDESLR